MQITNFYNEEIKKVKNQINFTYIFTELDHNLNWFHTPKKINHMLNLNVEAGVDDEVRRR